MKKILLFIIVSVVLLSGCSESQLQRKITVDIPVHRWTEYGDKNVWYDLVWGSTLSDSKHLFVDSNTNRVTISIPAGETVYVCAYPLKDMQCYGSAITPLSDESVIYLNQNDGFLCDLFLSADNQATSYLNYDKVRTYARNIAFDFRKLDASVLIADVLNGKVSKSSFKLLDDICVEPFAEVNGLWISENSCTSDFRVENSMTPALNLPLGVHRFYNRENDIILKIVVAQDGTFHTEM